MALTRVTDFSGRGVLSEIDPEFNNYRDYINNRLLANPLTSDLDFGNQFTIQNLRTFWEIRNGSEFGGYTGSSIQAAINDLPSTVGIVFLPPVQPYTIAQTINLRTGVVLWGYGKESTILQRTSGTFTATDGALLRAESVNGCGLLNLQLDGAGVDNTPITSLVLLRIGGSSSRFVVSDCYFRRSGTTAQSIAPGNDGIRLDSTGRSFWITNSLFEDFRRNGISVVNADRFFIGDNELTDTGGSVANDSNTAIDIEPQPGQSVIRGVVHHNVIRGWGVSGIVALNNAAGTVDDSHGKLTISDNEISDTGIRGLLVERMRNVKVLGNTLDQTLQLNENGTGSLHILNCEDVTVAKNHVYRSGTGGGIGPNTGDGIMVQGTSASQRCANIHVVDNYVDTTRRHSIIVNAGAGFTAKEIEVIGNHTRAGGAGAASSEITVSGTGTISDLVINSNRCSLDGTSPVGVHNGINFANAVTDVVLVGNHVKGSSSGGGSTIAGRSNVTGLEEGHNLET